MEKMVSVEKMLGYLQYKLDKVKRFEERYSEELRNSKWAQDEYFRMLDEMIACKEMVEALIGMPVNLQQDGRVTVGF